MSEIVTDAMRMMNMLPEADQNFAYEFIKKLVLAWDPDFTKATPEEAKRIAMAESSGFINEEDVDWDHLDQSSY